MPDNTITNRAKTTTAALTTLRYWHPETDVRALYGDDAADHDGPAYDGLPECLDAGLLEHVPASDRYRLTRKGEEVLTA